MSNSTLVFKIHKRRLVLLFLCVVTMACGITTPSPTRTPLPTLTPTAIFLRRSGEQIVRAIQFARLDIEDVHPLNPEDNNLFTPGMGQGFSFATPSLCAGCVGTIFSFNDRTALERAKLYFTDTSATNQAELSSWVFVKDNILLQLDARLSEADAKAYGAVLVQLR